MAQLEFVVALVDEVSKPARDVDRGIELVAKQSKSTAKEIRKLAKGSDALTKELSDLGKATPRPTKEMLALAKAEKLAAREANLEAKALKKASDALDRTKAREAAEEVRLLAKQTALAAREQKAMARSAASLAKEQVRVANAIKRTGLRKAAADTKRLGKAAAQAAKDQDEINAAIVRLATGANRSSKSARGLGTSLKSIIAGNVIATGITTILSAVARLGAGLATAGRDAIDFRQTTTGALKALAGGDAAVAARDFDALLGIAEKTAAPLEEVREQFIRLRRAGIGLSEATDITLLSRDVEALGKEGDLLVDKFRDLAKEGLVSESIFEDIAEQLGGGGVQGRDLLGKALGFDAATLAETEKGTAKLGKALKKLDPKSFQRIALDVAKLNGELGDASKSSKTMGQVLRSLVEVKSLEVFKDFNPQEILAALIPTEEQIKKTTASAKLLVDAFGTELKKGVEETGPALKAFNEALGLTDEQTKLSDSSLRTLGGTAGFVTAGLGKLVGAIGNLLTAGLNEFVDFGTLVGQELAKGIDTDELFRFIDADIRRVGQFMIDGIVAGFSGIGDIGVSMIDGLIAGVRSAGPRLASALLGIGQNAVKATKGFFGIRSPSKLFKELGAFTGEGFALGIEGEAGNIEGATVGAVEPGPVVQAAAASASQAAAGGSRTTTNNISSAPSISVQGAVDPEETARMVSQIVMTDVVDAISQAAAEVS